ncbi:MAG: dodecin family protein [Acidimicrobiales bacterium]
MADDIPGAVVKILELVGSSDRSFSDAARNAVSVAARSVRNIKGVEVLGTTAEVVDGAITVYKAHCKIAFVVEAGAAAEAGEGG